MVESRIDEGGAVVASVEVPLSPDMAFEPYTGGIMRWWRLDSHYWNDHQRRVGLRFEPRLGGRFIEVYDAATGEGFEIGRISAWEPGKRIAYSWRQAEWPPDAMTRVEVTFEPAGDGTRASVRHSGWQTLADGSATSEGYREGLTDLLGWYRDAALSPS